jgi:glyoxylase-like metal-dependent hydrolase (beta-lactamase superfamily II)
VKQLHRPEFFAWSQFDESRNLDFHSVLWKAPSGNVAIDPLPLRLHDEAHLGELGGVDWILITNSDHVRGAAALANRTGARLAGPRAERAQFPFECQVWLGDGDAPIEGIEIIELGGSKTPGELALIIEEETLVVGDLVRGHVAGKLNLLPEAKLSDRASAVASVRRLSDRPKIETVLVGDGWPVFRGGHQTLAELLETLERRTS